jgi:predicted ATPase/transcriptional regulator with XRE-family HTH domain
MQAQSFGDWLKRKRKSLDLTQEELAKQVGCSAAAIRKFEAEERRPSVQIVGRLAGIFDIPLKEQPGFRRFARGELRSAPAEAEEDFPWQASTRHIPSNLPATVTSLVGREQEISLVREYLVDPTIRLVSLIGPPGIGKTRLSLETARTILSDFPNGVFFVALAPLEDASLFAFTVAQVLGFLERTRQPAIQQLTDGIRDKQMLIVLDNCEHLIEDVAMLASELLSACPRLKILVTSRESLRIPGEWIYTVPALNVPKEDSSVDVATVSEFPALTLFSERARAIRSDFALDAENIQPVTAICAQLDGLPLAIELMAARMRLMTPQSLLEHLNREFVLSADGMRAASARQKTLNDAITWSYNLLSEEEQRLFAWLSIFSGGFTLEAAEAVFSEIFAGKSLSSLVTSLLDKSLLQRSFDPEARGETRFSMLVTIHQFALNRLQSMGNKTDARNKHLAYFLKLAEKADKEVRGPNQVEWLRHLSTERDNLRSSLSWAIETRQTKAALQMASDLSLFWYRRSDLSEGRQWLGQVLTMPDAPQHPTLYSYALAQLAFHTWLQIGPKEARPFVEQALSVARANHDKWNTAWALNVLGLILISEDNFEAAQSTLEKSKALFREIHDEWGYANAVISLGNGAHNQDDQATALALHEESLIEFRQLGDKYFEEVALRFIGMLQVKQGELTHGVAALREALILAQQINSKYEIASGLRCMGDAAQAKGNPARAVHFYWASRNIFDSIGAWQQEDDAEFEIDIAPCRAALRESEFADAAERGRAMTMEQAVEYALENEE